MPPIPRPDAPKKKKTNVKVPSSSSGGGSNRLLIIGLGIGGLVLIAAVAGYLVLAGGGGSASADAPKLLAAAGCKLQPTKALDSNDHSVMVASGVSKKWNTTPPTSGPHYAVPALWGSYTEPVNLAQLVHNLEHGGVFILYGKNVPQATVAELRGFYDGHQNGTVLAPLPSLGKQIALGAWTTRSASQPTGGTAYLAKCTAFDEEAFSAYLSAYQGKGPERFPLSSLVPGS